MTMGSPVTIAETRNKHSGNAPLISPRWASNAVAASSSPDSMSGMNALNDGL